jgi:hypothetical protein
MKEAEQWSLPPLWNRNDLTFNYKQDLIGHLTLKRPQAVTFLGQNSKTKILIIVSLLDP